MIKISELLEEVQKIQQENPDETYMDRFKRVTKKSTGMGSCYYSFSDQPMCIMGMAMHSLGVSIIDLKTFDSQMATVVDSIVRKNPSIFELDDEQALYNLQRIQDDQDCQKKWGECG